MFPCVKMPPYLLALLAFALLFASGEADAKVMREISGTVVKVSDGDTITVVTDNQTKLKVRLAYIDAPETEKANHKTGKVNKPGQPFGVEAEGLLHSKVFGKRVLLKIVDVDRYQRGVAVVYFEGRNINFEMVQAGMAECYYEYIKEPFNKAECFAYEGVARMKKVGVWSQESYESPAAFRKRTKTSG